MFTDDVVKSIGKGKAARSSEKNCFDDSVSVDPLLGALAGLSAKVLFSMSKKGAANQGYAYADAQCEHDNYLFLVQLEYKNRVGLTTRNSRQVC